MYFFITTVILDIFAEKDLYPMKPNFCQRGEFKCNGNDAIQQERFAGNQNLVM